LWYGVHWQERPVSWRRPMHGSSCNNSTNSARAASIWRHERPGHREVLDLRLLQRSRHVPDAALRGRLDPLRLSRRASAWPRTARAVASTPAPSRWGPLTGNARACTIPTPRRRCRPRQPCPSSGRSRRLASLAGGESKSEPTKGENRESLHNHPDAGS
jgi:hypothetical protein